MTQSWDRLPDEPDDDFRYFCTYRDMGSERTLYIYCRALNIVIHGSNEQYKRVIDMMHRWQWKSRADAYDQWIAQQQKKGMEIAAKGLGALQAHLQEIHRTKEMHIVNLALDRCKDVLRMPLVTESYTETIKNKTIVHKRVVLPPSYYFAAATLMKAASQVGRMALNMNRDDVEDMTPDQFADLFYKTQTKMAKDLPQGALPAPPIKVAEKPIIGAMDLEAKNGVPTAEKFRPPRTRPGENE